MRRCMWADPLGGPRGLSWVCPQGSGGSTWAPLKLSRIALAYEGASFLNCIHWGGHWLIQVYRFQVCNSKYEGAFLIEWIQSLHQIFRGSVHHPKGVKNSSLGSSRLLHNWDWRQSLGSSLFNSSAPAFTCWASHWTPLTPVSSCVKQTHTHKSSLLEVYWKNRWGDLSVCHSGWRLTA